MVLLAINQDDLAKAQQSDQDSSLFCILQITL